MAAFRNMLLNPVTLGAIVAWALGIPGSRAEPQDSDATLIADVETIRAGTPFAVGVRITLQEGWHTYWRNPGDSGMAPQLEWRLPEGFTVGPIQWPAPQRFDDPPFVTFGYQDEVLLSCEVLPPADLVAGRSLAIDVKASWLICKDVCVPRTRSLSLALRAAAGAPLPSAANRPLFVRARRQWPVADPTWAFRTSTDPKAILLLVSPPPGIPARALMSSAFFPTQPDLIKYGSLAWTRANDAYGLRLDRVPAAPLPAHLDGLLVLPPDGGHETRALDVHVPLAPPDSSVSGKTPLVDKPQEGEAP